MSRCRTCGAPVEWAITEGGRRIPLDPLDPEQVESANLLELDRYVGNLQVVRVVDQGDGTRVTHFATCPDAERHRRG